MAAENIRPTRRAIVTGAGALVAGAGSLLLAACSSSSGEDSGPGAIGGSQQVKPAGSPIDVVALEDVPVGGAVERQVSGQRIVVSRPKSDEVRAFSAVCTHQGCLVAPKGDELDCPCHGSRFAAATGKVLEGPATQPLPEFTAHVADGRVTVRL